MDITCNTVMQMGADARLEISRFREQTLKTLINKYKAIRDSEQFIEESVAKLLNEQIEETISSCESSKHAIEMLELISKIMSDKDNSGGGKV